MSIGHNSGATGATGSFAERLIRTIERVESVEKQKAELAEDIKDILQQAVLRDELFRSDRPSRMKHRAFRISIHGQLLRLRRGSFE